MKKHFFTLFACLFFSCFIKAQSGFNVDFENGYFTKWNGSYNNTGCGTSTPNPMTASGIDSLGSPPQHAIVSTGFDHSVTLIQLPVNNPIVGNYSVRLGDTLDGCGAAQLTYYINVTAAVHKFSFSYATVFNDNGTFAKKDAPKFIYNLTGWNGNCLTLPNPSCDTIVYSSTDTSFHHASNSLTTLYYSNWQTLCFDLIPYIGQTVYFSFTTSDADDSHHRGYAYLDCQFNAAYCNQTSAINSVSNLSSSVSVYPNPASNYINLTLKSLQNDEFEITLYDIQENILLKDNFASALGQITKTYKTENLPRGIYFVSIKTKQQGTIQKKVIIN